MTDVIDYPEEEEELDLNDGETALEKKYAKQMRQIHPQKIELPISTLRSMVDEQIKLNPEFQRRDRWDVRKQSRFVESIIMNVPVPPVFLGEDKYGMYVVLDGRQRLTAIYEFLRNTYALERLTVWSELNGMRYTDLEDQGLAPTIKRRFIPAVLLLRESSAEVKYDVFDRLNTGGVQLNSMEIRNAIFQGKFNRLLHKLSDEPVFRELWDIPQDVADRKYNTLYSQMKDVELVLRFFALREPAAIRGSFKRWLGEYLGRANTKAEVDESYLDEEKEAFHRAINSIKRVFGADLAFTRQDEKKRLKSAPLADALMAAFSDINPAKLDSHMADSLKSELQKMLDTDGQFRDAITTGTNGKGAIQTRVEKLKKLVAAHATAALVI
ncbi:DUF262 domain-containing protein [Variovorax ginsengisoli]|uniref:GmrSD restriction endonucleases N-terminal domain-containing protein n=1 Tax=Variovorax ginsengisoli TaxID=363844 RepID=A0ABT9SD18_9BURK|nr:DUF262 domain-containing protein [Variovorax ginsengisoli]MDP9901292.1 hypothetical protein [Variovorax ginsengisoli]